MTERTIHISNGGKKEVFDQICFHLGKIRGGYAIEAGKEVADVMEKLKSGEIKGAEEFADDEKALSTIAGTYINNTSKNIYDMDLVPNAWINLFMVVNCTADEYGAKKMAEGAKSHAASNEDPKLRAETQKYYELGTNTGPDKSRKYVLAKLNEIFRKAKATLNKKETLLRSVEMVSGKRYH